METKAKSAHLVDLKAYLEEEKARLQREIDHPGIVPPEDDTGYTNHMGENANEVFEQAMDVGRRRDHEVLLDEVEDALQRIEDGTYGICRSCGRPIDAARLRAVPATPFCISCQKRFEHDTL